MTEAVAAGWEALSRGSWDETLALLDGVDDDPEALEAVGVARWWLDDADATIDARERAYRLYRERGDSHGAARVAGALAWDSVLFGGRTAVARGWLDRGARLLEDEPPCPERAWLAVREAEVALAAGEPAVARAAAQRSIALAGEVDREDIQVVGRSLEGLALVNEGLIDEGMRRLDESAVAATAGDLKDLMWVGKVCCNLITACESVGDVERATQWCAEVKEFAQRWELRTLFNVCRTQYASVLVQTGDWIQAEVEFQAALSVFAGGRRAALLEGTARLGELRRRQGRVDEARELFAQSERNWTARIGLVELALDEGDAASALALAERLDRATEDGRQLDRIKVLALLVRAAVAAGEPDTARRAAEELDGLADRVGTTAARGAAAHAGGESARAAGRSPARTPPTRGRRGPVRARRDALRARQGPAPARACPVRPRSRAAGARGGEHGARGVPRARCAARPRRGRPPTRPALCRPLTAQARSRDGSARCSRSWRPAAAIVRSHPSSSSASTPCTGTWRTSCASSGSRRARRLPRARRETASSDPDGPIGPSARGSERWPALAKPGRCSEGDTGGSRTNGRARDPRST